MTGIVRQRLRITGHVQGVGFRYFVASVARNLGIVGWVRNEPDGAVLCEAQGPAADVESFAWHVSRGPAHARVERAEVDELPPAEPPEAVFSIVR